MCSFLFTDKLVDEKTIFNANKILKNRGPDSTTVKVIDKKLFLHNRLSITGDLIQPYTKNDITIMFNGEIYNFTGNSEADYIIDQYKTYNYKFATYLDGEYSLLLFDHLKQELIFSTDTFKTKPLWVSLGKYAGLSTYKSSLIDIGFTDITPVAPNTTTVYNLRNKKTKTFNNTVFDLTQKINNYDLVLELLEKSIIKRTSSTKKIFCGLSSGYDSGVVAACTLKHNLPINFYTIPNVENEQVLKDRCNKLQVTRVKYGKREKIISSGLLTSICEKEDFTEYSYIKDNSAFPLFCLAKAAKQDNNLIFISGTGGDEIFGDYYIKDRYMNSDCTCFNGVFPEDLSSIFPWKNFYNGSMRKFLTKDEYIIGALGIEARYPFLDKQLVQSFLNLTSSLKNKFYKAPLAEYLKVNKFPFAENEKIGFGIYV